jgi:hypothetical protein
MARRRRAWLAWIPAGLLAIGIAAVVVTTAVVSQQAVPEPRPTGDQVTDLNWSSFTEDGIRYMNETRLPRIDLADAPVEAAPLGLPDAGSVTVGPIEQGDTRLDYRLIVRGGGEDPGGLQIVVSTFTVTTVGGVIASVEAPLRSPMTFREALNDVTSRADDFGWTVDTAAVFEQVEAATRAGEPYSFTVGPADRIGVPVAVRADCDGTCSLTYEITPAVR